MLICLFLGYGINNVSILANMRNTLFTSFRQLRICSGFNVVVCVCCFLRWRFIVILQAVPAAITKVFRDVSPVCSAGIRKMFQRLPHIICKYRFLNARFNSSGFTS